MRSRGVDDRRGEQQRGDSSPPGVTNERADAVVGRALSPQSVIGLQRSCGNAVVSRLVAAQAGRGPVLARLRTASDFKTDSTKKWGLVSYSRSDKLKLVDDALAAYDAVRTKPDLTARENALYKVGSAIQAWKDSKKDGDEDWEDSRRAKVMQELTDEQDAELKAVLQAKSDADAKAEAARTAAKTVDMDRLLTSSIKSKKGKEKALAIFAAYMKEFRGTAKYTTTTKASTTVWDRSGTVACAMISRGLIDLLRHAGLTASLHEIAEKDFMTKQLGDSFVDPGTEGNVRRPNGSFADEKRFFFNKHWIVKVNDGELYLDPTSGLEVGDDAKEIVDDELKKFAVIEYKPLTYENGKYRLTHVGNNKLGDGAYELTPRAADAGEK